MIQIQATSKGAIIATTATAALLGSVLIYTFYRDETKKVTCVYARRQYSMLDKIKQAIMYKSM